MTVFAFIDAAPDPVSVGIVGAAILVVIGAIVLAAAGLVIFLWYRKRSMRHMEINFPEQDSRLPR